MSVSMSVLPNEVQRMVLEQLPYPSRAGCNRVSALWRFLISSLQSSDSEALESRLSLIARYRKILGKFPSDAKIQLIRLENGGTPFDIVIQNYTNYNIWLQKNPGEKPSFFIDDKKIFDVKEKNRSYFFEKNQQDNLVIIHNDFNSNIINEKLYEFSTEKVFQFEKTFFRFYYSEGSEEENSRDMNQMFEQIKQGDFSGYFEYFNEGEDQLPLYKLEKKDELEEIIKARGTEYDKINYCKNLIKYSHFREYFRLFYELKLLDFSIPSELMDGIFNCQRNFFAQDILIKFCRDLEIKEVNNIKARRGGYTSRAPGLYVTYSHQEYYFNFYFYVMNHIYKDFFEEDKIIECFLTEFQKGVKETLEELSSE